MGIGNYLKNKMQMWLGIKKVTSFEVKDPVLKKEILHLNDVDLEKEQYEYLAWYSGNADSIMYYYRILLTEAYYLEKEIRPNYKDYYWYTNNEPDVKKTHSGLPRMIIDTIDNCVSYPSLIKVEGDDGKEVRLINILEENNFKSILSNQIKLMLVLGDGAFFVNLRQGVDVPIIEYVSGTDCSFTYEGSICKSISRKRYYTKNSQSYQLIEKRSTIRIKDEETGEERVSATIAYTLFEILGDVLKEVDLSSLEETKDLKNLVYNNIPFMLAVPCIYNFDGQRGTSIYKGKIDLFDDFDQAISQEASIMRAITPVEYIDEASLEVDPDSGKKLKPSIYGKQYIYYKTAESITNTNPEAPHNSFYDIDFQKIDVYSVEVMQRALAGILSMATLGLDVARNSTDLAQREKEKITMKTVSNVIGIEEKILAKLFNVILACDTLRQDQDATYNRVKFTIDFPEYANGSFESKITTLLPLLQSGGISTERFVDELWGDSLSNEDKKKEIESINSRQSMGIGDFLSNE